MKSFILTILFVSASIIIGHSQTLYWGSPGVLNTTSGGAVNSMNPDGTGIMYNLVAHTDGQGRALAVDYDLGLVFYSSWTIFNPGSGGGISVYNSNTLTSMNILTDATTGIPDLEIDEIAKIIYWTDFTRGEIRSASYDLSGNLGPIQTEISSLVNPFGLALGGSNPVLDFYWSQTSNWSAPGSDGAVYSASASDLIISQIAVGFNRIDDVELDPLSNLLYWSNWASGSPNAMEGIHRANVDGTGQMQVVNGTSTNSSTAHASGMHGIALDPVGEIIYFTRGVSYADGNGGPEVSSVNMDGTGYVRLNANSDGWFLNGIALGGIILPDTIPTMSQWALLILALIITSMAVVAIRKRSKDIA